MSDDNRRWELGKDDADKVHRMVADNSIPDEHRAVAGELIRRNAVTERALEQPKKRYLRVSPELSDGDRFEVMQLDELTDLIALGDRVATWCRECAMLGDTVTLEVVEMTEGQFEAISES